MRRESEKSLRTIEGKNILQSISRTIRLLGAHFERIFGKTRDFFGRGKIYKKFVENLIGFVAKNLQVDLS